MANVLGVVGSPRKGGNTDVLVARVLDGARTPESSAETVFLGDLTIYECIGCHACWRDKDCARQDDMNALYPQIAWCDAIVFGTPVYWYGPTALIKAFVDRLVYFNCPENRPKIRGKKAALVIPFEETDPKMADLTIAFFEKSLAYLEMELVGCVLAPGVTRRGEVAANADRLAEAYALGQRLA